MDLRAVGHEIGGAQKVGEAWGAISAECRAYIDVLLRLYGVLFDDGWWLDMHPCLRKV